MSVKMAVLEPMPGASDATATNVNRGLRRKLRNANRRSNRSLAMDLTRRYDAPGEKFAKCTLDRDDLPHAFEDVILLAILASDLSHNRPLVAVRDVDAPVGIVLHANFLAQAILFYLARVPGLPGILRDRKGIHS